MPGMMDTILNLGLNDETVQGLAKKSGNERFALDSYRRFIQMYSDVVLGVPHHYFESILDDKKLELKAKTDAEISVAGLKEIIAEYKAKVKEIEKQERKQRRCICRSTIFFQYSLSNFKTM
jgi:pyruvate,orthophosphate dikinase